MPLLGLLLGRDLASTLGHAAHWIAGALLIATGGYTVIQAIRARRTDTDADRSQPAGQSLRRLLITGLALSIDNLAVGFALGTFHVNLAVAAILIGFVSVAMSLVGLELGNRIGARVGDRAELVGGLVLVGVGAFVASGLV
jgi:putative Mn2+ efflux pump MntP